MGSEKLLNMKTERAVFRAQESGTWLSPRKLLTGMHLERTGKGSQRDLSKAKEE